MDTASSVIAALDAGKLPSQRQLNDIIEWLLVNIIPFESPELDKLTKPGSTIARAFADLLDAYRQLGTNKNYDDLFQDTLWHLSEGDFSSASISIEGVDVDGASADINALRSALRDLLKTLWANISGEGSHLLNDFISFLRFGLADFAEVLEAQAAFTKESLRDFQGEVHHDERDPQATFERSMEKVKGAGSEVIRVGLSVKSTAEDSDSKMRSRLTEAFYQVCDRAQSDEVYKRALSTLFNIASKWLNRVSDAATTVAEAASLDNFIHDPTEEKHVHRALIRIRTLLERLAGKSFDDLFATLRACALDVEQDEDLKTWFDDLIFHVRSGLEVPGYARSRGAQTKHEQLQRRWGELLDSNSDATKKWKADLDALCRKLREFESSFTHDADLRRVREAHARMSHALEKNVVAGGGLGLHYALEQSSWFWQDLFNVYTQRALALMENIPIPRVEYVDREVEFILEKFDISSLRLLPGHAYIRNITDIEITAPGESSLVKAALGTLTHIRLQAIQLALRDVSFYYKDKQSTLGPNILTGIMQFDLPAQGLDIDFKFRLIPATDQGLAEREQCKRFFKVDRAEVKLSNDIKFNIKESNHRVVASVFKPMLVHRFRDAIERTLEEHIKGVFDFADAIAFDVSKRSEVFEDTGLGPGASFSAAVWSEIGHLRKLKGGLLSGWKATGTGLIKEGKEGGGAIALGAEPQILPGEKHGPSGYNSQPLTERVPDIEVPAITEEAKGAVDRVKDASHEAVQQVLSFRETVQRKVAEEKKCPGWKSTAFDVL